MSGLLYKDFVAVKGKWYAGAILGATGLFFLLRILTHQNEDIGMLIGVTYCALISPLMIVCVPSYLENEIFAGDEGKNCREYLLSLPISKKDYVAGKYVFLLLAYYTLLSVSNLWIYIYMIYGTGTEVDAMVSSMSVLLPLLVCCCMVLVAIELPFYILWGRRKGKRIKETGMVVLFFAVIIYVLFGDLTILDKINFTSMFAYLERNMDAMIQLNVLIPATAFASYYLSYRISCHLMERGEGEVRDES